jgi:hypothetical protein
MGSGTNTDKKNHKRSNFDNQQGSKTGSVFRGGSRNWYGFYKCKRKSSSSHNIRRIRAQTSPHANGDGKYHCYRIKLWHNKTKTHKSHGTALLVDQRQSETRTISCILGPGLSKFGRLSHKTSFAGASQKNARDIHPRRRTTDKSERHSRFRIARVC